MYGKGTVEVLVDKTFNDFNIVIGELPLGSHKKVWVRCTRCNEEFTREYRHKHQKHACSTHTERNDGTKLKWCNKCHTFLTYNCFSANSARCDGLDSYCKTCKQEMPSSRTNTQQFQDRRNSLEGWISWAISTKRSRCVKSGVPFNIEACYLIRQWATQNGKCYYSGVDLEFGTGSLRSAWMERIDPQLGYIEGNVVWASKAMNAAKNDASEDEFLELLSNIKNDIYSIPVRLECKKLVENAQIPSRSRSTDAGYDLYSAEDVVIEPQLTKNVATGIALACPPGYYYTIEGRSGLGIKGIMPFRGIIDAGYTNQVWVVLTNRSNEAYEVKCGDRIAQICLHRIHHADITVVNDFSPSYNQRGKFGFGSSGK